MFDCNDPVDIFDEDVAANLCRIAQEALNNALHHSGATRVTLRLDHENDKVMLSIADNGRGFSLGAMNDANHAAKGAGLRIMGYRAS